MERSNPRVLSAATLVTTTALAAVAASLPYAALAHADTPPRAAPNTQAPMPTAAAAAATTTPAVAAPETPAQRDARMKWWREAKFGLFIHFGVYAVPAGVYQGKPTPGASEWILNDMQITIANYRQFANGFNPTHYDPEAWVRLAKDAGMKYIVITAKHHEGFALYDSKVDTWNAVTGSPYGRDLLKPLAAACQKYGLKLGFYYSQAQDWVHPGGGAYKAKWDDAQQGNFDEYLDKVALPQVKELLTQYGPVAVLWWDTPAEMTPTRAARFLPLLKLQPGIITNNRLGGGVEGDTETPEQFIPTTGYRDGRDWESCMTMNNTWGYSSRDHDFKSSQTLVRNLVGAASKGGNYLLNIGPTAQGDIPSPEVQALREIGAWMKTNGQAIYATHASPFKRLSWGRCTQKPTGKGGADTLLYLHVFDWPTTGRLDVPGLSNRVAAVSLLKDGTRLKASTDASGVHIAVPAIAPDSYSSTIVLKIKGKPQVIATAFFIQQDTAGQLLLPARDAELHGTTLQYESGGNHDNLGYWTNPDDWASWPARLTQPGSFRVVAETASERGGAFTVTVGGQTVRGQVPATESYTKFATVDLGTITLTAAGSLTLEVRPVAEGWYPINLKSIKLVPVK